MYIDLDHPEVHELDQRSANGLTVTLLWSARTDSVFVCVDDERTNVGFHLAVDPADASDAFRHPYAYRRAAAKESGRRRVQPLDERAHQE